MKTRQGSMTEKDSKVKLVGLDGPMRVASDFPLEDILKKLNIPYRKYTAAELSKSWLDSPWSKLRVLEVKPMPTPSGLLIWLDSLDTPSK